MAVFAPFSTQANSLSLIFWFYLKASFYNKIRHIKKAGFIRRVGERAYLLLRQCYIGKGFPLFLYDAPELTNLFFTFSKESLSLLENLIQRYASAQ